MKFEKWPGLFARRSPAQPKQPSVAANTPVDRDDDAPTPNASPSAMPPPESDGILDETALEPFSDADPAAPAAEQAGSALLKAVFLARLRAQTVICRLRLESFENRPPDDRERRLAQIQTRVMDRRAANVEAAYQEALTCHEEVIRFLTRVAAGDEASRAATIRDALILNAATTDAETFLNECGEGGQGGRKQAARAAFLSGRLAEWRVDLPTALDRYSRALHFDPDNIEHLRAAGDLAHLLDRYDLAIRWRSSLARLLRQQPGAPPAAVALAQRDLAYSYLMVEDYEAAAPLYKSAMTVIAEELGSNHPEMATAWFQLGEMRESQGIFKQAHEVYQRTLKILESNFGLIDPRLCVPLEKLGSLSLRSGRDQEALGHYRKLLTVREKNLPADHPLLAESLAVLAQVHARRGDFVQAERCCARALRIHETLHGHEHPVVASLLIQLSRLCLQQGKAEEAARYRRAAEVVNAALRDEGPAEEAATAPTTEKK